jgi:DMATS type aromatic prenyltransferase
MKRVLEHLKEKQQAFAASSFVAFLQDSRLAPQERLSFLPCMAPFVMGFAELGRNLMGLEPEDSSQQDVNEHWALYLKDLQVLELDAAADFTGMLKLLWGAEGNSTRRTLYDLIDMATTAPPMKCQVLILALHAVGNVSLNALELVATEFEARTGKQLASIRSLRSHLQVQPWIGDTLEIDLMAGVEKEAVETIDEVFDLVSDTAEQLLAYAQHRLEQQRPEGREETSNMTFQEFGNGRLQALCKAVGYGPAEIQTVQRFFTVMSSPWGTQRIGTAPAWRSDITDDNTPFEFSLALEGDRPEVRFLIEAQNNPTTLQSTWEDGLALNERLNQEFGIPLDRFNLVKDLFVPRNPSARYTLWHAFCLKAGGKPAIKVYLNPAAQGLEKSNAVIKEALERLGFANAWRFISEVAMKRGAKDRLIYFSLDLSAHAAARIKVYIAHQDATSDDVEAIMSQAKEYVPGEAYSYYRNMLGSDGGYQVARSTQTCLAFTSDDDARPYSVTLYVPVRCYAKNDQDGLNRIRTVLEPQRYAILEKAIQSVARRPLEAGVGLIQWASMRREAGKPRMTFYLATEAYSNLAPRWVTPETVFMPTPAPAVELSQATA